MCSQSQFPGVGRTTRGTLGACAALVILVLLSGPSAPFARGESLELSSSCTDTGIYQYQYDPAVIPDHLSTGLRREVESVFKARDYLVVLENEQAVRNLQPDFDELGLIDCEGIIVTAPGEDVDFVSRFFAPRMGIHEDPVTGAAHSTLTPFWTERLGKERLRARQLSERGGDLWCMQRDDRVNIAGKAALYLKGFVNTD